MNEDTTVICWDIPLIVLQRILILCHMAIVGSIQEAQVNGQEKHYQYIGSILHLRLFHAGVICNGHKEMWYCISVYAIIGSYKPKKKKIR